MTDETLNVLKSIASSLERIAVALERVSSGTELEPAPEVDPLPDPDDAPLTREQIRRSMEHDDATS